MAPLSRSSSSCDALNNSTLRMRANAYARKKTPNTSNSARIKNHMARSPGNSRRWPCGRGGEIELLMMVSIPPGKPGGASDSGGSGCQASRGGGVFGGCRLDFDEEASDVEQEAEEEEQAGNFTHPVEQ